MGSANTGCLPAPGLQKNAMLRLPCERTQLLSAKLCALLFHYELYQSTSLGHYKGEVNNKRSVANHITKHNPLNTRILLNSTEQKSTKWFAINPKTS